MKKLFTILCLMICVNSFGQKDTVKVVMLASENKNIFLNYGYQVREKKNTIEKDSSTVLCCADYWQPVMYLDENKNCLPKSIVVWQSIYTDWEKIELTAKK